VKLPEGRSLPSESATPPEVKLSEGSARGEASFRKPPEVKLPEGRSLPSESATPLEVKLPEGSRRTPFLREEAEGRPSFEWKPKDVLFSKQVRFLRLPSESRHPARGEASRRKPKDALPSGGIRRTETSSESRRTCFFKNKFASFGFLRKAATPPEVKLSEGSRRKRNKFSKPNEVKDALPEGSERLSDSARGETCSLPWESG